MKRVRPLPINLILNGIASTADVTRNGHKFGVGTIYWHMADHILNRASASDRIILYGNKNVAGITALGGLIVDAEGHILCDVNLAQDPELIKEENLYRLNAPPQKWYQVVKDIDLSDFADAQNLAINFVR